MTPLTKVSGEGTVKLGLLSQSLEILGSSWVNGKFETFFM
jgi:hypothetical protein